MSNFLRRTTEGVVEAVVVVGGGGGVGTGMISSCTSSPSDSSINIKYSPLQNSASNASSKTSTMTSNGTTSTALTSITSTTTTSNDPSSPSTQTQEKLPEVPKLLVQKRLFNDIDLGERLESSGSFGAAAIYKGRFNEADVAVKIYPFREATAYSREIAIYRKVLLMRHENVLQCLGADQVKGQTDAATTTTTTKGSSPFDYSGLWLVTEYHRNGSLYEYLSNKRVGKGSAAQKLSLPRLLSLMRSLVSGLEYLHRETIGTLAGKVAIAHRDLQSRRSVLVREDGASCVIADFSLAATSADCYQSIGGLLKGRREKSRVNRRRRRRLEAVGSTRYLAPELLASAMAAAEGGDDHHFPRAHLEAYKRADM